ncbi:D-ribose pyranase [Thermoanaerobacterium butyriciformans]|uniref:D-ribose pyranase n=1 Tax=Thermoanaerobacterium butyriciformans TaxID=1702242 RepID=A0ABS4NDA3_9THEO|nr:D-ribose pyranase [Thermoanaerobacterium butyriciformans]MBP2070960.1 D-ribose pyranase [Thermoanaerobacterium butyriciformans]
MLNNEISKVVAECGHRDLLVISDSGLPIPVGIKRIDIALMPGIPSLIETLEAVLTELGIEKAYIAREMIERNNELYSDILHVLEGYKIEIVEHEMLKKMTKESKAVIRTGEFTPYANIILQSGVEF